MKNNKRNRSTALFLLGACGMLAGCAAGAPSSGDPGASGDPGTPSAQAAHIGGQMAQPTAHGRGMSFYAATATMSPVIDALSAAGVTFGGGAADPQSYDGIAIDGDATNGDAIASNALAKQFFDAGKFVLIVDLGAEESTRVADLLGYGTPKATPAALYHRNQVLGATAYAQYVFPMAIDQNGSPKALSAAQEAAYTSEFSAEVIRRIEAAKGTTRGPGDAPAGLPSAPPPGLASMTVSTSASIHQFANVTTIFTDAAASTRPARWQPASAEREVYSATLSQNLYAFHDDRDTKNGGGSFYVGNVSSFNSTPNMTSDMALETEDFACMGTSIFVYAKGTPQVGWDLAWSLGEADGSKLAHGTYANVAAAPQSGSAGGMAETDAGLQISFASKGNSAGSYLWQTDLVTPITGWQVENTSKKGVARWSYTSQTDAKADGKPAAGNKLPDFAGLDTSKMEMAPAMMWQISDAGSAPKISVNLAAKASVQSWNWVVNGACTGSYTVGDTVETSFERPMVLDLAKLSGS